MSELRLKNVRRPSGMSSRTRLQSHLIAAAALAWMASGAVSAQPPASADGEAALLPLCTPGIAKGTDIESGLGLYEIGNGLLAADLVDAKGAEKCLKATPGNLTLSIDGVSLNLDGAVQYQLSTGAQRHIVASSISPALCESYYPGSDQFALELTNSNGDAQGPSGLLGGVVSLSYSLGSGTITPSLSQALYGSWLTCHDATQANAAPATASPDTVFRAGFENRSDLRVEYLDLSDTPVDTLVQAVNTDISYKVRVTNFGESEAHNVRIREFVPRTTGPLVPTMQTVSCVRESDAQSCAHSDGSLRQDVASIAPGESLVYVLTRRVAGTTALPPASGALTAVAAFVDPSNTMEGYRDDNRRRLQIGLAQMVTITSSIRTNGTAGGAGGSISPSGANNFAPGSSGHAFTATANANYNFTGFSGTCPGTTAGNVFTTGAINAACTVVADFAIQTYAVTLAVSENGHEGNGTVTPGSQTINHGATASYTIAPQAGYQAAVSGCGGTAQAGLTASTVYTTAPISAACTVDVEFTPLTYAVTASAGSNGALVVQTPTVDHGGTATFEVTPNVGYSASVTGSPTCGTIDAPAAGGTGTAGPITGACVLSATFSQNTYTVTPQVVGGNGSITPATPQTLPHGANTFFTLTPDPTYQIGSVSGCGGTLVGDVYLINNVTASCTVTATFALVTHAVGSAALTNGAIVIGNSPVVHGEDVLFSVQPATGYHLDGVPSISGGSGCGTVTALGGNDFSAGPVTQDGCTLSASFAINEYDLTVSMSGANGTIGDPAGTTPLSFVVQHGDGVSVRATPAAGYHAVFTTTSGSCSFSGPDANDDWQSSALTGDCEVEVSFVINSYTVTAALSGDTAGTTIAPASAPVNHGAFHFVNVFVAAGHHLGAVSHDCAAGMLLNPGTPGNAADPATYRVLVQGSCDITAEIVED